MVKNYRARQGSPNYGISYMDSCLLYKYMTNAENVSGKTLKLNSLGIAQKTSFIILTPVRTDKCFRRGRLADFFCKTDSDAAELAEDAFDGRPLVRTDDFLAQAAVGRNLFFLLGLVVSVGWEETNPSNICKHSYLTSAKAVSILP
jgi:hypothetical protein